MKLGYNKLKPQPKERPVSQYARVDSVGRESRNPLESLRRSLQLTQDQFGEKCGVSKQVIQYYEAGLRSPTPATWNKMRENALQHGIILSDELLTSLVGEKLEKRKKRIEEEIKTIETRYAAKIAKIEQLNEKVNTRKSERIEKLVENYQELANRYGGVDENK